MFYDKFITWCTRKGVKPSVVAQELGIAKSTVTYWKRSGNTPTDVNLSLIADYFEISVDELLNGEIKKSPDEMSEDEEINEMLEELKNNPGKRLLFSKTKKATKEDIEKIIAMVDILTGGNDGGNYY